MRKNAEKHINTIINYFKGLNSTPLNSSNSRVYISNYGEFAVFKTYPLAIYCTICTICTYLSFRQYTR